MSELSKKLVTYESMTAYTEALKQYISDYVSENAGSGGGSVPTELTNQVSTNTGNIEALNNRVTVLENTPPSFEENIPDGINSYDYVNLGDSPLYEVNPNSSIVIRLKDENGNNPFICLGYPKIGQVNEYTIIINNNGVDHTALDSGILAENIILSMVSSNDRSLVDNSRFYWNTPPLYNFNETDKIYELNIKVIPYKEERDANSNNVLLAYDAFVTWTEYGIY
jgi:hypothetical protein